MAHHNSTIVKRTMSYSYWNNFNHIFLVWELNNKVDLTDLLVFILFFLRYFIKSIALGEINLLLVRHLFIFY